MTDHDLIDFGIWREKDDVVTDDDNSEWAGLPVTKLTRVADQLNQSEVA